MLETDDYPKSILANQSSTRLTLNSKACAELRNHIPNRSTQWLLLASLLLTSCGNPAQFFIPKPATDRVNAQTLGVIVNRADPLSVEITTYYQQKRQIPAENLIEVEFPPNQPVLSVEAFNQIAAQVAAATPDHIQAYALTWAAPYRVDCMSITAAFAVGFSEAYCARGCQATAPNPYFNSHTPSPYNTFGLRPTMAIAAVNLEQAQKLIDRGVQADGTHPWGRAYLISTDDRDRNTRAQLYPETISALISQIPISVIESNELKDKPDVMFYFTGLATVNSLETNYFFPGAVADHLTSFGGQLTDSPQMSSLHWLEAGATGSYGTVVEPCNFPQKFPHPGVMMAHYLAGDTLVEAYWKSVAWLGQGIFIGEPLAQPYGP